MKPSRKIPPGYAYRLVDFCPPSKTAARFPGFYPPGNVSELSRCRHFVRVYDAIREMFICVKCGLPDFTSLKLRAFGTNLPAGTIEDESLSGSGLVSAHHEGVEC